MSFFRRKPDNFNYSQDRTCLTCSHHFAGKYCSRCGEKVIEPYDRSIRSFIDHTFNAVTFVDGKFARSFKQMLLHPGKMSSDMAVGIRQPYMRLVSFFFVANFIYFLFPVLETFNSTLTVQMHFIIYRDFSQEMVNQHLDLNNLTLNQFAPMYNAASTNLSKLLLIIFSVIIFPFITIINYSKKKYLSDHFLFSMEYSCYLVFIPTVLYGLAIALFIWLTKLQQFDLSYILTDRNVLPFAAALTFYFLVRGLRRFYAFPWWRILLNTILLIYAIPTMIIVYRFILFNVTMWTL